MKCRHLFHFDLGGIQKWSDIAKLLPGRVGKQIRERWQNHLDPTLKKTEWTIEEDLLLLELHKKQGNRWMMIARGIDGRRWEHAIQTNRTHLLIGYYSNFNAIR